MVVRHLASKRGALRLGVVRLVENGRRSDGIVRLADYAPVYGLIFTAHRTVKIAVALNLVPCFTPVESPESNFTAGIVKSSHGPAERLAFVDEPSVCIARA